MSAVGRLPVVMGCLLAMAVTRAVAQDPVAPFTGAIDEASKADVSPSVGPFRLTPNLEFGLVAERNLFASPADPASDTLWTLAPRIEAETVWSRHRLHWVLGGQLGRYANHPAEDFEDLWFEADGRLDVGEASELFGGIGIRREHEAPESPDGPVADPTTTVYGHAGAGHRIGDVRMRLVSTLDRFDYAADARDRDQAGVGLRATVPVSERVDLYGQLSGDRRRYDEPSSTGRDSDGVRAGLGVEAVHSNRLRGGLYLGTIRQEYDAFGDRTAVDVGAHVSWLPSRATGVKLSLDRSLEETTVSGSPGYLNDSLAGTLTQRLRPGLTATARLGVERDGYLGIDRDDDLYSASFSMRRALSPSWYLDAGYRARVGDSSLRGVVNNSANLQSPEDFAGEQLWLRVGTDFVADPDWPGAAAAIAPLTAAADGWGGPYIGLGLGADQLGFQVEGWRDEGVDIGPYGRSGVQGGLFAGYGVTRGAGYLGVEASLLGSEADFGHAKDKDGSRTYTAGADPSFVLSLRPGLVVRDGSLLYARIGYAHDRFDISAALNDEPESAFDGSVTAKGWRYGLGADIPAGERAFVRIDYGLGDYDDFDLDLGTENERWTPARDRLLLGLGWRLDGTAGVAAEPLPVSPSGPYAGLLVSRGGLYSDVTGVHRDSGGAGDGGPYDFYGDFGGNQWFGGAAFGGYAWRRGNWLLALEGEVDGGIADWRHERTVGGRNFSVERHGERQAALRVGYRLANGTELYARGGRTWSRYRTRWIKGGSDTNHIERDDDVSGTSLGLGAEMQLSERIYTRLEYIYNRHGTYGFTTIHDRSDEMEFENSEGIFRVGFGIRM